jgi:UDP-N-acetylmuramate--alanine ligase
MIQSLSDLSPQSPIHFVGIGGCGMSGLALTLRKKGFVVTGSDMADGAAVERLRDAGIPVAIGHNGGNVPPGAQAMVYSAAVKPENPEYMTAGVRGIPLLKYAQMLGVLMRDYKGIAVAGTHGKTTTTALIVWILRALDLDPGFVIGGDVPQLGGGAGVGSSEYLVAEACEFDRSFLNLWPRYAIVNNIEEDHLDYYKDLDEIVGAFRDFAMRLPEDGVLVYGASSPNIDRFIHEVPCRTIGCALEHDADYWASDIRFENGRSLYRLHVREDGGRGREAMACDVDLALFGRHNVINSLSAIALLHEIGLPLDRIVEAAGGFRGVHRRFETVYDQGGVSIVDDYAHHPTEIQTVLKSAKQYFGGRRLVAVFQPHQHSRTRFLLKDFARSFRFADLAIVPDIYFVRDTEQERSLVHARDLVREIIGHGGNAIYIPSFSEIETFLTNNVQPGDVILTMGAGNVWQIGRYLAEQLGRSESV